MNESTVPFISIISTFSNNGMYNEKIKKDLLHLVPVLEEYIHVKLTSKEFVCKSFISHLTRLLERIYGNQLIQGKQQRMNTQVSSAFWQHHEDLQAIFSHLFPDNNIELTPIEIYFLVLYILRLRKELG